MSRANLGSLSQLPDEILDEILGRLNDARALGMCAQTCAAMRVLCYEEPLWKAIAINAYRGGGGSAPGRKVRSTDRSIDYAHIDIDNRLLVRLLIRSVRTKRLGSPMPRSAMCTPGDAPA